jgi:hypothetical protein
LSGSFPIRLEGFLRLGSYDWTDLFQCMVPGFIMVPGSARVIHTKGSVLRPDLIIAIIGSWGEGDGSWFDWIGTRLKFEKVSASSPPGMDTAIQTSPGTQINHILAILNFLQMTS